MKAEVTDKRELVTPKRSYHGGFFFKLTHVNINSGGLLLKYQLYKLGGKKEKFLFSFSIQYAFACRPASHTECKKNPTTISLHSHQRVFRFMEQGIQTPVKTNKAIQVKIRRCWELPVSEPIDLYHTTSYEHKRCLLLSPKQR